MKVELEKVRDEIIGLRPIYTEMGSGTVVYLRRGELVDSRGMRSIITALARTYAIDMAAQRSQLKQRLHRQVTVPFYLGAERVFVPLKMRQPLAVKDPVYGYVDVRCMGQVHDGHRRTCRLQLLDGRELDILSNRSTVEQCRAMGRSLLDWLQSEQHADEGESLVVGAAVQFHRRFKVMERRLIHIEAMIAEVCGKYE